MRAKLKLAIRLLLVLPIFTACGDPVPQDPPKPVAPASMFLEQSGHFCMPDADDKFTIGYIGSQPLGAQMQLYIVCHQKDTVFRDIFPAENLLPASLGGSPDSVKVREIHRAMHKLLDGKLGKDMDSTTLAKAEGQPVFSYAFPDGQAHALYFSKADKKVLNLIPGE